MSLISVVCPTYNSEAFIAETLDSIIAQDLQDFELIVVDDGSIDKTVEIIKQKLGDVKFKYEIIECSHAGPGAARNIGVSHASCDWVAFLDSDDAWFESKLSRVLDIINTCFDINFICHLENIQFADGSSSISNYKNFSYDKRLDRQLYFKNFFSTSAVVLKRDLFLVSGYFDENMRNAQDYELWLKFANVIKPKMLNEVLGKYIIREGNISSGPLIPRYINLIKIAWRYRSYTSKTGFTLKMIQILTRFLLRWVKKA